MYKVLQSTRYDICGSVLDRREIRKSGRLAEGGINLETEKEEMATGCLDIVLGYGHHSQKGYSLYKITEDDHGTIRNNNSIKNGMV